MNTPTYFRPVSTPLAGKCKQSLCCVIVASCLLIPASANSAEHLTLHEWGTFTVLQDEEGRALRGVNVNEEGLPEFVHRLHHTLILQDNPLGILYGFRSKGIPVSYPQAIMRMETPIIYVYPPAKAKLPMTLDIHVEFQGGWISEWYPNAEVSAPGFKRKGNSIGKLTPDTVGAIHWKNLTVGTEKEIPKTDTHVWLAPRDVNSSIVTTPANESEQYLFYRGVASIEAPLRVTRSAKTDMLDVRTNPKGTLPEKTQFDGLWLVDIRADGGVAYRELESFVAKDVDRSELIASVRGTFAESEYSNGNLADLRKSMHTAIVKAGLFADEADAMLNTWELSYFKSPGLRLFFTLPQAWTDVVLPLTTSKPAETKRVMIGRVEMVTPAQRQLLNQIATSEKSDPIWLWNQLEKLPKQKGAPSYYSQLVAGKTTFEKLGINVPEDYHAFMQLGRFREAIMLDAIHAKRKSHEGLQKFATRYRMKFVEVK